jgi:hypothetical protein
MEDLFFFSEWLAVVETRLTENINGMTVVDIISICEVGSVYFWHRIHQKELRVLQEMVQSFHEVQS